MKYLILYFNFISFQDAHRNFCKGAKSTLHFLSFSSFVFLPLPLLLPPPLPKFPFPFFFSSLLHSLVPLPAANAPTLNPARESEGAVSSPSGVRGGAPPNTHLGIFLARQTWQRFWLFLARTKMLQLKPIYPLHFPGESVSLSLPAGAREVVV